MHKKKTFIFFIMAFFPTLLWGQNDAIKIAEAKYAIEQQKDCNSAKNALSEVSEEARKSPLYVYYCAKTYDCLSDYERALAYYNQYLEYVPNEPQIISRIAELNYLKRASDISGEWYRFKGNSRIVYTISHDGDGDQIRIQSSDHPVNVYYKLNKTSADRYEGYLLTFFGEGEKDEFVACTYVEDGVTKEFTCQTCCNNRHRENVYAILASDKKSLSIYVKKKYPYTTLAEYNTAFEYYQRTGNSQAPICRIGEDDDYSFVCTISK